MSVYWIYEEKKSGTEIKKESWYKIFLFLISYDWRDSLGESRLVRQVSGTSDEKKKEKPNNEWRNPRLQTERQN